MIDYLTHYYKKDTAPFQTLSALTRSEALKVMNELADDSPIYSRFNNPNEYLDNRSRVEEWLINSFIRKGCEPTDRYPNYTVLGTSKWIEEHSINYRCDLCKIELPVSLFSEHDISFTVPDSMVTYNLEIQQPANLYNPEFHGQVFTLTEAKTIFNKDFMADVEKTKFPGGAIPYVEAQVWNHNLLKDYYRKLSE